MVSRTFQSSWFDKWKWLHYSAPLDVAFCHTCVTAIKTGKMKVSGNVQDSTFLSGGFSVLFCIICKHKVLLLYSLPCMYYCTFVLGSTFTGKNYGIHKLIQNFLSVCTIHACSCIESLYGIPKM